MISWLKLNYREIASSWYKVATITSFILGALIFVPDYLAKNILLRIITVTIIFSILFFFVAAYYYAQKKHILWTKSAGAIIACYDDLFKIANDQDYKYIVIPVNTAFDTIVDEPNANVDKPLVSPNTLHGRWLKQYATKDINEVIQQKLQKVSFTKKLTREQKKRGNLLEYPLGTVVAIKSRINNTIFLLTALSVFDSNNNAHADEESMYAVIKGIIQYCDQKGQGYPVYLPVMGTGRSRTILSKNQAFEMIKYSLFTLENKIHEKIYIVVYPKDKGEISIFGRQ